MLASNAGKTTEVVLQTIAIKNIFTNGKSLNLVFDPNNLKTGIGYKTEIPPIKNKTTIVLNFKNSMKIMAKTPEP